MTHGNVGVEAARLARRIYEECLPGPARWDARGAPRALYTAAATRLLAGESARDVFGPLPDRVLVRIAAVLAGREPGAFLVPPPYPDVLLGFLPPRPDGRLAGFIRELQAAAAAGHDPRRSANVRSNARVHVYLALIERFGAARMFRHARRIDHALQGAEAALGLPPWGSVHPDPWREDTPCDT